jgi:hypothetical protein
MESINEKRFYEALGVVPDVPDGILEDVERRVRRKGVIWRVALAACLALAFAVPALVMTNIGPSSAAYAGDTDAAAELFRRVVPRALWPAAYAYDTGIADELFYAFEYLGGDDLFDDNELFTSLTGRGFSDEN